MDPRYKIWGRVVRMSHHLAGICDVVARDLVYNRERREAWFARTIAWKRARMLERDTDTQDRAAS